MVSILTTLAAVAAGGFFTAWAYYALDKRRGPYSAFWSSGEAAAVVALIATGLTVVIGVGWGCYALAVG